MEEFIKRLQAERVELVQRMLKLHTFMGTQAYADLAEAQKVLMRRQSTAMLDYAETLLLRLAMNGFSVF